MAEIEFGTFEAVEKVNPYAETVQKLADLNREDASVTITVPVHDEGKTKLAVQKAANAIGKTARIRLTDKSGVKNLGTDEDGNDILDGNVKIVFTLTKRHNARRGSKPAEATPVAEGETVEAVETPADEVEPKGKTK